MSVCLRAWCAGVIGLMMSFGNTRSGAFRAIGVCVALCIWSWFVPHGSLKPFRYLLRITLAQGVSSLFGVETGH